MKVMSENFHQRLSNSNTKKCLNNIYFNKNDQISLIDLQQRYLFWKGICIIYISYIIIYIDI